VACAGGGRHKNVVQEERNVKTRTAIGRLALIFSLLLVATGLAAQRILSFPSEADQSSAVGSLRSINTAEVFYDKQYRKGFSPTLISLGVPRDSTKPSTSSAGLLDNSLTGGKKNNYVFTYEAGRLDATGKISTYAVSARPAKWQSGVPSFYTDQTAIIRRTDENRAATAGDPELQ
jgi:type IV pilus assembly protein PilA